MSVEVWLVRHGETEWTALGKVCGWADVVLTERGRNQAASLHPRLSPERFDSVWTSDMLRTQETARLAWGEAQPDERLRELHFGDIEGIVWEELDSTHRDALLHFEGFHPPNGEHVETFRARVRGFLEELPPGRHLLFVHAGLIRLVLRDLEADQFLPPVSVVGLHWTRREVLFIEPGGH